MEDIYGLIASLCATIEFLEDMTLADEMFAYLHLLEAVEDGEQAVARLSGLDDVSGLTSEEKESYAEVMQIIHDRHVADLAAFEEASNDWIHSSLANQEGIMPLSAVHATQISETSGGVRNALKNLLDMSISSRVGQEVRRLGNSIGNSVESAIDDMNRGVLAVPRFFDNLTDATRNFATHVATKNPGCESQMDRVINLLDWVGEQVDLSVRDSIDWAGSFFGARPDTFEGLKEFYSSVLKGSAGGILNINMLKNIAIMYNENASRQEKRDAIVDASVGVLFSLTANNKRPTLMAQSYAQMASMFGVVGIPAEISDYISAVLENVENSGDKKAEDAAGRVCPVGPTTQDHFDTNDNSNIDIIIDLTPQPPESPSPSPPLPQGGGVPVVIDFSSRFISREESMGSLYNYRYEYSFTVWNDTPYTLVAVEYWILQGGGGFQYLTISNATPEFQVRDDQPLRPGEKLHISFVSTHGQSEDRIAAVVWGGVTVRSYVYIDSNGARQSGFLDRP